MNIGDSLNTSFFNLPLFDNFITINVQRKNNLEQKDIFFSVFTFLGIFLLIFVSKDSSFSSSFIGNSKSCKGISNSLILFLLFFAFFDINSFQIMIIYYLII